MTTLTQLLERLEAATEGSRELDYAIHVDVAGWVDHDECGFSNGGVRKHGWPPYTTSLDAATALIGEMLPDHMLCMSNRAYIDGVYQGDGMHYARLDDPTSSGGGPYWLGIKPSLPLALCIALVRALIAKEAVNENG